MPKKYLNKCQKNTSINALGSITKPLNVLSIFLTFESLKPYVLIYFVLIKRNRLGLHTLF